MRERILLGLGILSSLAAIVWDLGFRRVGAEPLTPSQAKPETFDLMNIGIWITQHPVHITDLLGAALTVFLVFTVLLRRQTLFRQTLFHLNGSLPGNFYYLKKFSGDGEVSESVLSRWVEILIDLSSQIRRERLRNLTRKQRLSNFLKNSSTNAILTLCRIPGFATLLKGLLWVIEKIVQWNGTPLFLKRFLRSLLTSMTSQYIAGTDVAKAVQVMVQMKNEKAVEAVVQHLDCLRIPAQRSKNSKSRPVRAIADILGEGVKTVPEAMNNVEGLIELMDHMAEEGLEPNISTKVTLLTPQILLDDTDPAVRQYAFDLAVENFKILLRRAREIRRDKGINTFIWIDKEEYEYRDVANRILQKVLE
ncbi:MAG: proline dehydrogenase family protein, partial [Elusimicrobia bacterium]|nr:proline dehydrogenase family protein [Elusimicrobiota bacterium]